MSGRSAVADFVAERVAELEEAFGQLVKSGCETAVVEDAVDDPFLFCVEFDWSCCAGVFERFDDSFGACRCSEFPEEKVPASPRQSDGVGFTASVDSDADVVEAIGHELEPTWLLLYGIAPRHVQGDALELVEAPLLFLQDSRARLEQKVFAANASVEGDVDQGPQRRDVEASVLEFLGRVEQNDP